MLYGIGASEGIGKGTALKIESAVETTTYGAVGTKEQELKAFEDAMVVFEEKTLAMAKELEESSSATEAAILHGHLAMVSDPFVTQQIRDSIESGNGACHAVEQVLTSFADMFRSTGDELTMQRAADVEDIRHRIINIILGVEEVDLSRVPEGTVVVTEELTPSMTVGIKGNRIKAIVTEKGGYTSHSAILARAMEIPAVLSVENALSEIQDGQELIVDGISGKVVINPTDLEREHYERKEREFAASKEIAKAFKGKATLTKSGEAKEVYANIRDAADGISAKNSDAEGVGLFRTEFLFMDRRTAPTEEEQFFAYKKVAQLFGEKPVIVRTLDVGGDKEIPYLDLPKEENPFMGFRAVRYCLENEDMYKLQLRAALRAGVFGNIWIMVPMITTIDELRAVKALKRKCEEELEAEGKEFSKDVKIGIMIETPAAAVTADILAREADFFSIGTNDLVGYTMAADRGNGKIANLYNPYEPSVLRLIKSVCQAANEAKIPVGMCGEAASNPALIPCWVAFGLDEFSVSQEKILATRYNISLWSIEDAKKVAERALSMENSQQISEFLRGELEQRRKKNEN